LQELAKSNGANIFCADKTKPGEAFLIGKGLGLSHVMF
jgi:hypothetical protein